MSVQARKAIQNCLDQYHKWEKSYFWSGFGNARERSRREKRFENDNPSFILISGNDRIEVDPTLSLSRNKAYYRLNIRVNGKNKTIRVLSRLV